MTSIYVVRSVHTQADAQQILQGNANSPVDRMGIRQIYLLRQRFRAVPVHRVYSSPNPRAVATAQGIAQQHKLQVFAANAFSELDLGNLEGRPIPVLEREYGEAYRQLLHMPHQYPWKERNLEAIARDLFEAMMVLVEENRGKNIVLVSHQFALRSLLCHAKGLEVERTNQIPLGECGSVSHLLVRRNNAVFIPYIHDLSHYPEEDV